MRYVRSVVAGLVMAAVAAVAWIIVRVVLPIAVPYAVARVTGDVGVGVDYIYVTSDSVLLAALAGFVAGFVWTLRRAPKRPARASG